MNTRDIDLNNLQALLQAGIAIDAAQSSAHLPLDNPETRLKTTLDKVIGSWGENHPDILQIRKSIAFYAPIIQMRGAQLVTGTNLGINLALLNQYARKERSLNSEASHFSEPHRSVALEIVATHLADLAETVLKERAILAQASDMEKKDTVAPAILEDADDIPTIPADLLMKSNVLRLQMEREDVKRIIDSGSPNSLDGYIKTTLLKRLKETRKEIARLTDGYPDEESSRRLVAGDLMDHEDFISVAIIKARKKINDSVDSRRDISFEGIQIVDPAADTTAPTSSVVVDNDATISSVAAVATPTDPKLRALQNVQKVLDENPFDKIDALSGDALKKYSEVQLKTSHQIVSDHIKGLVLSGTDKSTIAPEQQKLKTLQAFINYASRKMDAEEVSLQAALANLHSTATVSAPTIKAEPPVLSEAVVNNNTALRAPESKNATAWMDTLPTLDEEAPLPQHAAQNVTTVAYRDVPAKEGFSFGKFFKKKLESVKDAFRTAAAIALGSGAALAAAAVFNMAASNAPEAPDAPKLSPAASGVVVQDTQQAAIIPQAEEAPAPMIVVQDAADDALQAAAAEKMARLVAKPATPAVKVGKSTVLSDSFKSADSKATEVQTFDIATFRPNLETLIKACKQAGGFSTSGVCAEVLAPANQ